MSLRRQPIRGLHPGVIESGIISLSNGTRDGGDLPKVGAAVRDVSQRPGSKFVMQVVLEDQSHVSLPVAVLALVICTCVVAQRILNGEKPANLPVPIGPHDSSLSS